MSSEHTLARWNANALLGERGRSRTEDGADEGARWPPKVTAPEGLGGGRGAQMSTDRREGASGTPQMHLAEKGQACPQPPKLQLSVRPPKAETGAGWHLEGLDSRPGPVPCMKLRSTVKLGFSCNVESVQSRGRWCLFCTHVWRLLGARSWTGHCTQKEVTALS